VTTAADVQVRADGTWLVVRSASAEDRAAANGALGDLMARHGFTQASGLTQGLHRIDPARTTSGQPARR
jgi:hypothetical protein